MNTEWDTLIIVVYNFCSWILMYNYLICIINIYVNKSFIIYHLSFITTYLLEYNFGTNASKFNKCIYRFIVIRNINIKKKTTNIMDINIY